MGSTHELLWGKERQITSEGKKKKKDRARARPCVELSPSLLTNTVEQRIEQA